MSTHQGDNKDYLARIDEAIARSGPLQEWLVKRSSQDRKHPTWQTQLLLDSLREPAKAERWINDPKLARFLPIVLRADSSPGDLSHLEPWYRLLLKSSFGVIDFLRRYYYPLAIGATALLVFYFLCISIIPAFEAMFQDFELRLPALTKLIFSVANFVANRTLLVICQILIGLAALVGILKLISYIIDRLEGYWIIGAMRRGTKKSLGAMARWTGALGELLSIGMPVGEAIKTAGLASQKPWLLDQSQKLFTASKISPHKPWSTQPGAGSFSASAIAALDIQDQGTPVASLVREIAQSYAVRWSSRANLSLTWLGPILLLLVAKLVFLLVLALFMPLLSLITSLSG